MLIVTLINRFEHTYFKKRGIMRRQKTLLKTSLFRALFSSVFVFAVALVIRLIWSINMQNSTGMAFVDNLPNVLNIPKSILLNGLAALIFIAIVTIFIKLRFSLEGREISLAKKADRLIAEEHRVRKDIELLMDKALILSLKYHDRDVTDARKILKEEMEKPLEDTGDIKIVLKALDGLLGKLPEEEIKKFSKTKYADLYKNLLEKYGVK